MLTEKENSFSDNMDKLEEEFKLMLIETNNKYKEARKQLEKKMGENVKFQNFLISRATSRRPSNYLFRRPRSKGTL